MCRRHCSSFADLLFCRVDGVENLAPCGGIVRIKQLHVETGQAQFGGAGRVRNNDVMVRERLRLDASPGALDHAERIGKSALIAQRSEIAGIDNAEITKQLAFDHRRRNPAEQRIQQVGALFVQVIGRLHLAHPRENFRLYGEIPWHEIQLVRDLPVRIDGFVDCGERRLQLSLMEICLRKQPRPPGSCPRQ